MASSPLVEVRRQLFLFLEGGTFAPLHDAVMDATSEIDDDASLSDDERDWYDELYDAVSAADEDPVDEKRAKAGIIGAAELREQLRAMKLDRLALPPS